MTIATKEITEYPFIASDERATHIRDNYNRVDVDMSVMDVETILGEPDEVRPLYEPTIKKGKQIGYTHWYVIRRMVQSGSANDKKEALVRISFNLDDRVSRVDSWGLIKGARAE